MSGPAPVPALVRLEDLKVGDLLAEGGEGRVHTLPRLPHLVFKAYRGPTDRSHLEQLVGWPDAALKASDATRVRAASAWPVSVVEGSAGDAVGLLVPRAPRRFAVRHRDGHSRLASLSYLTADPGHRAVAYGLDLPARVGVERVGLAYALAHLLAAFEAGTPPVGHGDLSTKNVLWSLQRGPEVYVIDCDNCERYGPDGAPLGAGRRRAMTPNWDDPAVPRGGNPTPGTDRYSMGLVFVRVVGAANFPVQARQRSGGPVEIAFPVPPGPASDLLLDPGSPVWDLCARSLSVEDPAARPPAARWVDALGSLLGAMGAAELVGAVRATTPITVLNESHRAAPAGPTPRDVRITPTRARREEARTWSRVSPTLRYGPGPEAPSRSVGFRYRTVALARPPKPNPASAQPRAAHSRTAQSQTRQAPTATAPPSGPAWAQPGGAPASPVGTDSTPLWPVVKAQLAAFWGWWIGIHQALFKSLRERRAGAHPARRAAVCVAVDFTLVAVLSAVVALVLSPILQS